MAARRSKELKTVPEYDKLSIVSNAAAPDGAADRPSADRQLAAGAVHGGGPHADTHLNNDAGGAAVTANADTASLMRTARQPSMRHGGGPLGRISFVHRLQHGGRQLIDMGRLRATWVSKTLVHRSADHDYVNEEDQGVVALLARHVDVPTGAWQRLQDSREGRDTMFWQYATNPTDPNRTPGRGSMVPRIESQWGGEAADESGGRERTKPRWSLFGLPIIPPYNPCSVLWTMTILLLDLTYTAFWVPINVAFCTPEYGKLSSGCTSSDLVGGALYAANTLLGFQIGLVARHGFHKRTVVHGQQVAWLYVWYGKFWLDLLASVPFLYLVVMLLGQFRLQRAWVNCLSLLRLLRMIRLVSISKVVYMDSLSGRFRESRLGPFMSVSVIYSVFLAYQLAVAINLFACIMILCAYFQGYGNSWMSAVSWAQVPQAPPIYQWFCAVYWMIVTATTTGFGDFVPRSLAEQIVANVAMLGGMIMFGVLVASIGNALSRATSEAQQAYNTRRKIMHVMDWAQHRGLPPDIKKKVQKFYAEKYGDTEDDAAIDSSVMSSLPSRLRAKVAKAMCVPLLGEVHVLGELPTPVQELIAEIMRPIRLPAGEDLCQQGDVATCLWILDEGSLEAVRYKQGSHRINATPTSPCLVGESVLLGDVLEACRVRSWTLRTVTTCHMWGVTIGELYPLLRMYPVIGNVAAEYVKLKTMGQRFVNTTRQQNGGRLSAVTTRHDDHWCELAELLNLQLRQLRQRRWGEGPDVALANGGGGGVGIGVEEQQLEDLLRELGEASMATGSPVQPVLDRLLTFLDTRIATPSSGPGPQMGAHGMAPLEPQVIHSMAPGPPSGPRRNQLPVNGQAPQPQPPHAMVRTSSAPQQQYGARCTGHDTAYDTAVAHLSLNIGATGYNGGGLAGAAAARGPGLGGGFQLPTAITAPQLNLNGSIDNSTMPTAGTSGGGWPAGRVQCPGCQRCVCPSCGQGVDPPAPPQLQTGAPGTDAADQVVMASVHHPGGGGCAGAGGGRPAAGPAVHAWVNRVGTLRRVSIGSRQDQVWASERRSMDRRNLGAMSIMPFGE